MDNYEKVELSVKSFPDQCFQAFMESSSVDFPEAYKNVQNVVVAGMGGSILPTDVLTSVFSSTMPIVKVSSYNLPAWANEKTLVFLSSYSGSTEEVLSIAKEAKDKGCLITGSTSGRKLGELLKKEGLPCYVFDPKHNPSNQPRLGAGYGLMSQVGMLNKLGLLTLEDKKDFESEVLDAIAAIKKQKFAPITSSAQVSVNGLVDLPLVVFGAEHLAGNAHVLSNQTNETAKIYSSWHTIPEANHHLLEGLEHRVTKLGAVFLDSNKYSESIAKRSRITQDLFTKKGHGVVVYHAELETRLKDALDTMLFSGIFTLELARKYGVDPISIPTVDYFKEQLEKND